MNTFITNNSAETVKAGKRTAKLVKPGAAICLSGELGAGKTTFLKGLAAGIGIKDAGKRITSASFVLAREFPEKNFYHLDLYRLNRKNFFLAGLDQYLSGKNIVAIEWSDIIGRKLIKNCLEIKIKMLGGDKRKITVTGAQIDYRKAVPRSLRSGAGAL